MYKFISIQLIQKLNAFNGQPGTIFETTNPPLTLFFTYRIWFCIEKLM